MKVQVETLFDARWLVDNFVAFSFRTLHRDRCQLCRPSSGHASRQHRCILVTDRSSRCAEVFSVTATKIAPSEVHGFLASHSRFSIALVSAVTRVVPRSTRIMRPRDDPSAEFLRHYSQAARSHICTMRATEISSFRCTSSGSPVCAGNWA